jgi:hypothetical protein
MFRNEDQELKCIMANSLYYKHLLQGFFTLMISHQEINLTSDPGEVSLSEGVPLGIHFDISVIDAKGTRELA